MALALLSLAACGGRAPEAAVPAEKPAMQVVRCEAATPAPVVIDDSSPLLSEPKERGAPQNPWRGKLEAADVATPAPTSASRPWTPYAIETAPQPESAPTVAHAVEAAVRGRLAKVDACFTAPAPMGSLRAMLEIDASGALTASRIGGLGDRGGEDCIGRALEGLTVVMPKAEGAEIACDLARGEARAWRVAVDAGYDVIEVTRGHVRHGTTTFGLEALDPSPLPSGPTYLIVAEADAEGALLAMAIGWAFEGDSTVVAVRGPAGPPTVVGVARTTYSTGDAFEAEGGAHASITVTGTLVHTCVHHPAGSAPVADPRRVEAAIANMVVRCRELDCESTLGVVFDATATAHDLADVIAAAHRAGFERVLIGGRPQCGG